MRRKISLYIDGQLAEVDDQSFILFNYTQEDLTNPSVVRSSYSQSVTLPATSANNSIFSSCGRLDRVSLTGFKSSKRTPFSIFADDGRILESGYLRLDEVTRSKGEVTSYKVTLFGGLGSLFYSLSYDEDGNKRTLGSLTFADDMGDEYSGTDTFSLSVADAWDDLSNEVYDGLSGVFNFIPMYNGLPTDFDANKALVKAGVFDNLGQGQYDATDATWYRPKGGNTAPYLITFANKQTEWKVFDLRNYLQRPIVNVIHLLDAIAYDATEGGHRLTIDASVYLCEALSGLWMTLPLISSDHRSKASIKFSEALETTMSPGEFLIGFAKMYGMVFLTTAQGTTMMTRDAFYKAKENEVIDLTSRIATSEGVSVSPVFADSHYFEFAIPGIGTNAKNLKDKTGREYGSVRVDTNYPFNDDVKSVLDGTPFKVADYVRQYGNGYIARFFSQSNGQIINYNLLPQSYNETIKATLYKVVNGVITSTSKDVEIPATEGVPVAFDREEGFYDWMDKLQSEDSSEKGEDGSGIFVILDGFRPTPRPYETPEGGSQYTFPQVRYYITSYDATRVEKNNGVDCWDLRHEGTYVTSLPVFTIDNGVRDALMSDKDESQGIFTQRWKSYIDDLYHHDTRKMTCKVDLRGLEVNQTLLRRFFWYDNSLWVLNSVKNYSLTTEDLAECEFIRVKEKKNYTNGQI